MVFSERSHYKNLYPDIACTISTIGLYDYTIWLMGALLVANYISVRRYFLAVELLPPCTNGLTYLPCFSATPALPQKCGKKINMGSSNFSFCYFRTFILWNYSYRLYDKSFPIVDRNIFLVMFATL